ncbi:MAG: NTPase [Nitrososphaerota archaeon]
MRQRLLIGVTGPPGCGKTTAVERASELLKKNGFRVSGILTREVRVEGRRIGFDIIDVETGASRPLARVSDEGGARLGKYRVYKENLDGFATELLRGALAQDVLVVIDEVGPMELMSQRFRQMLRQLLKEAKEALLTLHYYSRDPIVLEARTAVSELIELRRGEAVAVAERIAKIFINNR